MTRYDAILLAIVFLIVALSGYFIYREYKDPILLPGAPEESTQPEAESERATVPTEKPEMVTQPKPPPAPEPPLPSPPVPDEIQKSFEEEIAGQFGQLATLMEVHLSSFVGSIQDQTLQQSDILENASQIVREALQSYQSETSDSLSELSDTLGLIDDMRSESEAITSNLEEAREGWNQLFDDVATINEKTDDRLNEDNFEFQTYAVEGFKTLNEIARELEASYDLPENDLGYLLNRFNDIEYRFYDPGGRRASYRVVANETLRVPIPKTTGDILEEFAFSGKLRSQISSIDQATTSNANLRRNLSRQVDKLQQLEANIQAITSVSATLAQMDLSAESPLPDEQSLSPDLREAWLEFETAATAYRSASDSEEEKLAQERLKRAITRLLGQYEKDYLKDTETPDDPVDFYLRFIEKYRPGALQDGP